METDREIEFEAHLEAELRRRWAEDEPDPSVTHASVEDLYVGALTALLAGNTERARLLLDEASTRDEPPASIVAVHVFADRLAETISGPEAEQGLREIAEGSPRLVLPAFLHGLVLLDGGDIDRAQAIADQLVIAHPESPRGLLLKGSCVLARKEYDSALKDLDAALQLGAPLSDGVALARLVAAGKARGGSISFTRQCYQDVIRIRKLSPIPFVALFLRTRKWSLWAAVLMFVAGSLVQQPWLLVMATSWFVYNGVVYWQLMRDVRGAVLRTAICIGAIWAGYTAIGLPER